ncbi:putative periplasmic substrate-binding component of ABC-type sugar transport system [Streptomyces sp. Tu6071]|nr:putative periplasmic substrate-binding component of ABC-type sugar transport system [Streptomyces sp. Tu6071]
MPADRIEVVVVEVDPRAAQLGERAGLRDLWEGRVVQHEQVGERVRGELLEHLRHELRVGDALVLDLDAGRPAARPEEIFRGAALGFGGEVVHRLDGDRSAGGAVGRGAASGREERDGRGEEEGLSAGHSHELLKRRTAASSPSRDPGKAFPAGISVAAT